MFWNVLNGTDRVGMAEVHPHGLELVRFYYVLVAR